MPAGFYAKNDFGTFVADDNNPSLSVRLKTSVSVGGVITTNTLDSTNAEFPVLAIRGSQTACQLSASWVSGTTRRFTVRGVWDGLSQSIECFVFDRPVASTSTFGLRIRDDAGRWTFDAMGKYGRVSHIQNGNGTYTGGSGRIYAGALLSTRTRDEIIPLPGVPGWKRRNFYVTGVRTSANTLVVEDLLINRIDYASADPDQNVVSGTASVMVLDVTGY